MRAQRDGTITINLDQAFLIESTESARQRKICLLNLSMSLPKGWQMAINEVEFNGMAAIEKDGRGELALRHRFAGTAGVAVSKEIGQTDAIEDFQAKAPIGVTDNSFSPCGGEFQFKTSLTAQVLNGAIAIASGDRGAASIVYRSTFRECNR